MPKLHLKRTPEEEAARQWHKKQKKEAKSKRRYHSPTDDHDNSESSSHKRRRTSTTVTDSYNRKWSATDDDGDEIEYGPHPPTAGPSSSLPSNPALGPNAYRYKPDYEAIRAELEEQRFREKMCGAFEDDERLDSLEARLNDFAHVPGRWRTGGTGRAKAKTGGLGGVYEDGEEDGDGILKIDPRYMDEEEYAEWIRVGMYRKTHAEEHAEQRRKKALKAAHRAQEKALKVETERLEKAAEADRWRKKQEKENRRWDYARERYDRRWKELLALGGLEDHAEGEQPATGRFSFGDIPWPVFAAYSQRSDKRGTDRRGAWGSVPAALSVTVSLDDLTAEAISMFLLPPSTSTSPMGDQEKKERKEKLRETFLRFHPDKFEGRIMKRVEEGEKVKVRQAIGQVVRVLNTLMGEGT